MVKLTGKKTNKYYSPNKLDTKFFPKRIIFISWNFKVSQYKGNFQNILLKIQNIIRQNYM